MRLVALYVIMSVVTFVAYAIDKFKASHAMWRTPEKTLHLMELFCGWPGAIVAQQLLRHKSYKKSFRHVFWAMAILNVVAVGVLIKII